MRAKANSAEYNLYNSKLPPHTFPIKPDRTIPIDARLQIQRSVCEF